MRKLSFDVNESDCNCMGGGNGQSKMFLMKRKDSGDEEMRRVNQSA
jgi:hypothetical protein